MMTPAGLSSLPATTAMVCSTMLPLASSATRFPIWVPSSESLPCAKSEQLSLFILDHIYTTYEGMEVKPEIKAASSVMKGMFAFATAGLMGTRSILGLCFSE